MTSPSYDPRLLPPSLSPAHPKLMSLQIQLNNFLSKRICPQEAFCEHIVSMKAKGLQIHLNKLHKSRGGKKYFTIFHTIWELAPWTHMDLDPGPDWTIHGLAGGPRPNVLCSAAPDPPASPIQHARHRSP